MMSHIFTKKFDRDGGRLADAGFLDNIPKHHMWHHVSSTGEDQAREEEEMEGKHSEYEISL